MGLYRDHVLPRLINVACAAGPAVGPLRDRVCAPLTGEVVEIGFGSGLNVPHYPAAVTGVTAVEPSDLAWRLADDRVSASRVPVRRAGLDGQRLPFEDDRFDCTASVFAAMFAPRPERVAHELFRVTRPGNTVGMASWVPHGFSGRMFGLFNEFAPRPEGVPAPVEWGREEIVEQRFDGLAGTLEMERRTVPFEFESTQAALAQMEKNGPQVAMKQALGPELYDEAMRRFEDLMNEFNEADDGSIRIRSEYLLVVARKRG